MEHIQEVEVKSKEDILIDKLEKQIELNTEIRNSIIPILQQAASNSEIDKIYKDAKLLSSKLEIFSTLNTLLDSNTKDSLVIAKTVMSKKSADVNEEVAKYTIEMLKNINPTQINTKPIMTEESEKEIDDILDSIETPELTEEEKVI